MLLVPHGAQTFIECTYLRIFQRNSNLAPCVNKAIRPRATLCIQFSHSLKTIAEIILHGVIFHRSDHIAFFVNKPVFHLATFYPSHLGNAVVKRISLIIYHLMNHRSVRLYISALFV